VTKSTKAHYDPLVFDKTRGAQVNTEVSVERLWFLGYSAAMVAPIALEKYDC
jgi:hypothetical protein